MEGIFKRRSRHELKMKFKKEERINRVLVDKCLSQGQTFDPSIFDSDEDSEDEQQENAAERKKKEKENRRSKKKLEAENKTIKKRKHRVRGRRYFNDSDDADESELASESETFILPDKMLEVLRPEAAAGAGGTRIQPMRQKRNSRNLVESPLTDSSSEMMPPVAKRSKDQSSSLLKSLLSQSGTAGSRSGSPHPAFPPALLAANPSLANASPGSLVVVASPSPNISSPNAQLLQVYMVGEDVQVPGGAGDHQGQGQGQGQSSPEKSVTQRTGKTSESRLDTTSIGRVRTHSGTYQP
jgi:hypothetical protein